MAGTLLKINTTVTLGLISEA